MENKIFVALSTFGKYGNTPLNLINNSKIDYNINPLGRRLLKKEIIDIGKDATGIIAGVEPYDSEVLKSLPKLRCISRAGVGVDNIDLDYAKDKKIIIKNTPEVVIRPVAELTIAMIFDLLRKTTFHTIMLKNNCWEKKAGNLIFNKTIGIIGTGRIGKATSELLIKLGATIIAYDISPDKKWANKNNIKYFSFEKLLSSADIISLHASPKKHELPIIGKKEFDLMKEGLIIINTSRGGCINENDLVTSLQLGKVGAAGIDVFSEEPYNGKLIEFENVVLTPHIATLTEESRLEMEIQATKNLLDELN